METLGIDPLSVYHQSDHPASPGTGTGDALRNRIWWYGGGQSVFPARPQNMEENAAGDTAQRCGPRAMRNTLQSPTINLRGQQPLCIIPLT